MQIEIGRLEGHLVALVGDEGQILDLGLFDERRLGALLGQTADLDGVDVGVRQALILVCTCHKEIAGYKGNAQTRADRADEHRVGDAVCGECGRSEYCLELIGAGLFAGGFFRLFLVLMYLFF